MRLNKRLGARIVDVDKPKTLSQKLEDKLPYWVPRVRVNVYLDPVTFVLCVAGFITLMVAAGILTF